MGWYLSLSTHTETHFSPDCDGTNESFSQYFIHYEGRFPRNMKLNKVIPTFKKGDKAEDLNNYRPIAMSSSVSKIYEKIFLNRLEIHLQVNKIIRAVDLSRSTIFL